MHRIYSAAVSLLQKRRYACTSLILIHCILIKRLMNDKPILVAIDRQLIKDTTLWSIPDKAGHQEAYAAYWAANNLAARNGMQPIDSLGSVYFYAWKPS